MKNNNFKILLIYLLVLALSFVVVSSSDRPHYSKRTKRSPFKILDLNEGEICRESQEDGPNYKCMHSKDCKSLAERLKNDKYLDICSFDGRVPIVCCPTTDDGNGTPSEVDNQDTGVDNAQSSSGIANKKCQRYKNMDYPKQDFFFIAVVGGIEALSQEFPHMAIIGYGTTTEDPDDFRCGGSLISERWILTAAHCHKDSKNSLARWVRLGDLNIASETDFAQPKDYRVIQHVLHPGYRRHERYNDIALFRLDQNVKFSSFVRPICLNTNPMANPTPQIATGWGKTATSEATSDILLKVALDVLPTSRCNISYFGVDNEALKYGVLPESMVCAGSPKDDTDTCSGDSGGPLQVKNTDNPDTYTQYGITSFGAGFCGNKETPGVYTRVSKYIQWIEEIVWPND